MSNDNTPTNTKQLREEIRDRIKNILEEYIYAEYNSEIHAEPMARWPEEMINEILTLLQAQEQEVRREEQLRFTKILMEIANDFQAKSPRIAQSAYDFRDAAVKALSEGNDKEKEEE